MDKNQKILLAADVELFMELERDFLQRDDLDLLIAKDGRKALQLIQQQTPQIAFLGLEMQGMSAQTRV